MKTFLILVLSLSLLVIPATPAAADNCTGYSITLSAGGSLDVTNSTGQTVAGYPAALRVVNLMTRQYLTYPVTVPTLAASESAHLLDVSLPANYRWTLAPTTRSGGCSAGG